MRFMVTLLFYCTAQAANAASWNAEASRGCAIRVSEIRSGRLSADDDQVISGCIINGYITDRDVKAAYDDAKRSREKGTK